MPKIDNSTPPRFEIPGVTFSGIAAPSRGSAENGIWRAVLAPGHAGLPHKMTREEIVVALSGQGRVRIGQASVTLIAGDAFAVPAFTEFALECAGAEPFEAMVVLPTGGRAIVGTEEPFQPAWSV